VRAAELLGCRLYDCDGTEVGSVHDLRFVTVYRNPGGGQPAAVIDWPAVVTALGTSLPCSGGEQRMLKITASLADGIPVDLRDTITGIDDRNIQSLLTAIRRASGKPS
jgi:hypothetical protein